MDNKVKKNDYVIIEHPNKNNRNNRIFIIGITCIAVLVIGLIIGNIVIKLNQNSGEEQTENEGSSEEVVVEIDGTEEEGQNLEETPITKENFRDIIEITLLGLDDQKDPNAIYEVYQKVANRATDDETKVEIYKDCINAILKIDLDRKYGDLIMAGATEVDNILQTVMSAAQAYNYASAYGDEAAMTKFNNLMTERAGDDGSAEIDPNDTRG